MVNVVMANSEQWIAECDVCHRRVVIDLPIPVKQACQMIQAFEEAHGACTTIASLQEIRREIMGVVNKEAWQPSQR